MKQNYKFYVGTAFNFIGIVINCVDAVKTINKYNI